MAVEQTEHLPAVGNALVDFTDGRKGVHRRAPSASSGLSAQHPRGCPSSSALHDPFPAAASPSGRVKGRRSRAKLHPCTRPAGMRQPGFLFLFSLFLPNLAVRTGCHARVAQTFQLTWSLAKRGQRSSILRRRLSGRRRQAGAASCSIAFQSSARGFSRSKSQASSPASSRSLDTNASPCGLASVAATSRVFGLAPNRRRAVSVAGDQPPPVLAYSVSRRIRSIAARLMASIAASVTQMRVAVIVVPNRNNILPPPAAKPRHCGPRSSQPVTIPAASLWAAHMLPSGPSLRTF